MKKKWLIVAMLVTLVVTAAAGFVAADELLTLRNAIQRAVTDNTRIKLAELSVEKAERKYDNTMDQMDYIAWMYEMDRVEPDSELEELFMQLQFVGPISAEVEKDLAQRAEEDERSKLAVEAQQQYLNLLRAKEGKALMELSVERANDLKRLAETAYQVGTAARSDVMQVEARVAAMEVALFGAESAVKVAEAAMNMTMGAAIDEPVSVDAEFVLPEIGEIDDLEQATRRALANRIEVVGARGALSIADSVMKYTRNRYGSNDYESVTAELSLEEARLGVQAAEDAIRYEVFALYQKLAGAEKQLAARQKSVDLTAENYRLSKLRYELGVATQGEVVDAMLALSEEEMNFLNEKYDSYIDYLNWRLKTGLPVN